MRNGFLHTVPKDQRLPSGGHNLISSYSIMAHGLKQALLKKPCLSRNNCAQRIYREGITKYAIEQGYDGLLVAKMNDVLIFSRAKTIVDAKDVVATGHGG